ncbi:hypothetical protein CDL12_00495 [Handroanthus impetiginosus]|uniref:Uncharacterized protein n=1 Tax=Handroanthus impetiginosus TaxID=429701 RepID=A0A2G9IAJ1_9LAMI|nr:hypothetical protein CDL12_00495 [Handroanthus impetiginosus]
MGNNIGGGGGGGKKKAKIMKIDGETFKLKLPAKAMDVLKDYPATYVLLESEAVKKFGIRAPQLEPEEELRPKNIYFLVELPEFPEPRTRRARSVAHMGSAKERLEGLMLRQKSFGSGSGPVRVKMRIPRAQINKLMEESKDEAEVAERILDLCLQSSG